MIYCKVTKDWKKAFKSKRALYAVVREALTSGADMWHGQYRPKHFTHEGAQQYGYSPRSASYLAQKRRRKGHTLPLVWSGASRTLASIKDVRNMGMSSIRLVIRAPTLNRSRRRRGNFSAESGGLNFGGRKSLMREEMTRITPWEQTRLVAMVQRTLQQILDRDIVHTQETMK